MPAKTVIFNNRAEVVHTFALGPRNTIMFSPHGRFVLVAGFGNLAGQMDIYDLEKDFQKLCTIEASNASVCEWSPDGKHILTATTSPRLRVDNGVKVWHVGGGIMYVEDMQELYHVTWRPQPTSSHPLEDPLNPVPTPHPSALAYLGTVKTPSKPAGAYRPPGARGSSTPLAFKREDEGGAAFISNGVYSLGSSANGFGKSRRAIPGAETVSDETAPLGTGAEGDAELSKAALKNKKKREAKKAKEAADKAAGLAPSDNAGGPGSRSQSRGPGDRDRRDRRGHERNRSRTNGELAPRTMSVGRSNDARNHERPSARELRMIDGGRARSQSGRSSDERRNKDGRAGSQQGRSRGYSGRRDGASPVSGGGEARSHRFVPAPPMNGIPQPINTKVAQVKASEAPDLTVTTPGGGGTPQEKKIRALTKKLRAIDDLKMRRAGGETLEGTQIKKMETEEGVRRELEALGWADQ